MSALESRQSSEPVEDLVRRSGVVEIKKKNEQLTPAERVKRSLVYSGILGRNLESILQEERPKAEVEKLSEIAMVLRRGKELGRVDISENKGKNTIDVRHYVLENAPKSEYVVAFVKTEGGQRIFDYDEVTKEIKAYQATYQERPGSQGEEYVQTVVEVIPDASEIKELPSWVSYYPILAEAMAKHYDLRVEDMPQLNPHELTHRITTTRDEPVRSERVAFLHDAFYGMDQVPITELRAHEGIVNENGRRVSELCSTQQMAPSLDKNTPMEPISSKLMDELEGATPGHPLLKSLMRLAVTHCLVGQTDGHANNVLAPKKYDSKREFPESEAQLYGIDLGLAYPLSSRTENVADFSGKFWKLDMPSQGYLSYPLHVIEKNKDWKLDEEAWQVVRSRVESCRAWIELYDRSPEATDLDDANKEVAFLLHTFLFRRGHHLRKNEKERAAILKMAKRDMRGQLNMAAYIAENGRPPQLTDYGMTNNRRVFESTQSVDAERATPAAPIMRIRRSKQEPVDVTSKTEFQEPLLPSNPFSR